MYWMQTYYLEDYVLHVLYLNIMFRRFVLHVLHVNNVLRRLGSTCTVCKQCN